MSVYWDEARRRWRYNFTRAKVRHAGYCLHPDGRPAANKTEARACEDVAKGLAATQVKAASAQPRAMTLAVALAAHATRHKGKAHFNNIRAYVRELLAFFGADTPVAEIDEAWIWKYIAFAREQPRMVYVGGSARPQDLKDPSKAWRAAHDGRRRTDATINRYLDCLRASLGAAAKARDPATGQAHLPNPPAVPELVEPTWLPKPIGDADLARIIAAAPPRLAQAVVLTILMGFRKAEVFSLTIGQVDEAHGGVWLSATQTKGGRDELMPASPPAMALLRRLVAEARAAGVEHLITWARKTGGPRVPIKNPRKAWARVMRDLGLKHRFHDTKASFSTGLARAPGVTAFDVQNLSRHKDMKTTMRYIAIVDEARHAGAAALGKRAAVVGLDLDREIGKTDRSTHKIDTQAPKKQKGPPRRKALTA